jgi:hypothetical protein
MPVAVSNRSSRAAAPARSRRLGRRSPMPRTPPYARYGISRIDSKHTHGWFARLGYRTTPAGKRPKFVGFFPDLRYGGKRKALVAAQTWVKAVLKTGRKVPR